MRDQIHFHFLCLYKFDPLASSGQDNFLNWVQIQSRILYSVFDSNTHDFVSLNIELIIYNIHNDHGKTSILQPFTVGSVILQLVELWHYLVNDPTVTVSLTPW